MKEKVIRAINNRLYHQQHGARRKLARNQKRHAKKQQAPAALANDVLNASNSIQPASGDDIADDHPNNDLVNEEEEKKIEEFMARRAIVNSKKKLSTKAMLETIPSYNNFEIVNCILSQVILQFSS